jgi:acyl transferase domain-containing protein
MNLNETTNSPAIAIIGMTGRFPGARNIDQFWENLQNGVESVRFFNRDELLAMGIDDYLLDNPKFVAADAILDDMDLFDASFFDYSAREAEILDPQHRHFLECAWEALESAGYNSEFYNGRIAVYAGSALSGYMIRNINTNPDLVENVGTFKIMIANSQDFLATRVSYKLNLMGPSINVNTLCSSSMVAIHLGCQNLLNYGCDLALAGGVSFQISRNEAFFYQEGGIGASDGHCRAFDARANGTVSGSGLGIVVLKRLEDALVDGDHIYAVIKGSAVNNDGSSKNSFTAPNVDGQAECIAEAVAMAEVDPEKISYIETHGTGTNLGDPIEIAALTKVFRSYTQKKNFCSVGSVKTNIGHLVTAGGIASLIKTVLAMNHHLLPPSLNFEEPNPKIDFKNSPFYVQTALSKWEGHGEPLLAGVSSFGIGGTNAHVIVEEAPVTAPSEKSKRLYQIATFSAKTETTLERMTGNLIEYLQKHPDLNPADVAFTLQAGRRSFNYRRMVVYKDLQDLIAKLKSKSADVSSRFYKPKEQPVVFVFPGAESELMNTAWELYQTEPIFRHEVNRCCDILKPLLNLDLRRILYPGLSPIQDATPGVSQGNIPRTIAFIIDYALAKLWMDWEVIPQLMIGRGAGEYVAACLADVFSLEDALLLVSSEEGVLREKIKHISFNEPKIPFVSTVTGNIITSAEATGTGYWMDHPSLSTRFKEGFKKICQDPDQIIISLRPDPALNAMINEMPLPAPTLIKYTHQGNENRFDSGALCHFIGEFWLAGGQINWLQFYHQEKRHRIPLPTYPFQRERYWVEPGKRQKLAGSPDSQISTDKDIHELLNDGSFKADALSIALHWKTAPGGPGGQNQRIQLEQALRFRAGLEEYCRKFFAESGWTVDVSPIGVQAVKTSGSTVTDNGKQPSKKARPDLATEYVAPRNEMEQTIVNCWQNILGFDRIGIYDDFFELGGHSLLAAAVANELRKIFQIEIPLTNLFETKTVVEIVDLIETYRWAARDQTAVSKED